MLARALALALLVSGAASGEVAIPPLSSPVTDLTGTLDGGQRAALEARLLAFEREKGSQVALLLLPTTQPEEIEQYAIRLADEWKIGRRRGIDDGVIVIVALQDRAVRIEVGDGLEGPLPDAIANRITDDVIVPRFREGDYYGGISDGIEQIINVIEGEPLPPPRRGMGADRLPQDSFPFLLMAPLLVGGFVRMTMNRFLGATSAGALGGGLAWWIVGASAALGIGLFCFLIVLLAGSGAGRRGGWSSGGLGGGSGGGGGWSGGGGHFSGGGATGRW